MTLKIGNTHRIGPKPKRDRRYDKKPTKTPPNLGASRPAPSAQHVKRKRDVEMERANLVARLVKQFDQAELLSSVTGMLAACDAMEAEKMADLARIYRRQAARWIKPRIPEA